MKMRWLVLFFCTHLSYAATDPVQCAPVPKAVSTTQKPFLRIVPHPAESLDPMLKQAYQSYLKGDFDQAHLLYQQVLKQQPRNQDALLGLAVVAQYRGEVQQALSYYAQVLMLNPQNTWANAGVATLNGDENRESELKHWLQEQPDSTALHFALGNHYANEARWAEAQQEYFTAFRLDPHDASVAFNLAVSLEQLGQVKLAVQYYQQALLLNVVPRTGLAPALLNQHIEALQHSP